jgi:AGZA family xanthine/uracil permease-like MFS transporter
MWKIFGFDREQHSFRSEIVGGITTFMTMSYIIFVNPVILSAAGMDANAVRVATCLAAALGTLLMGVLGRYPVAQAPAMGHNAFFAFMVCGTMGYSWPVALGANFISGSIFVVFSFLKLWEGLVNAVPNSLKHGIAAGIGLLIALIGMEYGGIVVSHPATYITLGKLTSPAVLVTIIGILSTLILMQLRVPGAILWGLLVATLTGLVAGVVTYHGVVSLPPAIQPTFLKLDISGALKTGLIPIIFIFFFLDIFDTMGTLIGVSAQAGFIKDGKLPRTNQAMLADALATVTGTLLGTSTVTSYIESTTGIAQGARTGLANLVTALLFILALFFNPLAEMIGGTYGTGLHPVIAPALIVVGYLMMKSVVHINWDDSAESIPAFLAIIIMPFTFSITEGIAFGFISYTLLKLVNGQGRQVHWFMYVMAMLFIVRYIFIIN